MANTSKLSQHINALNIKQRVFKSELTDFSNDVSEYQESATARTILRERIEQIRKQFDAFNVTQDELGQHGNFEQLQTERKAVRTTYYNALAVAIQILDRSPTMQNQSIRTSTDSPAPSTSNSIAGIHLPKISLPRFDGRLEKWLPFKDAFLSMIQGHPGLTDIQRFNYLRLSVSGQAEAAIESFTTSEENYKAAWAQLIDTYDNQRALIMRHTTLLLETPAMSNGSPDEINKLINHMQSHVRSLQSLGRTWENIASDLITGIAINRMDRETRRNWEQTLVDTSMPLAADMFKHLRNASHQANFLTTATNAKQTRNTLPEIRRPSTNLRPRTAKRTFATMSKGTKSPSMSNKRTFTTTTNVQTCKICKASTHQVFACPTFGNMTINERWTAITAASLCPNCLLSGHTVDSCKRGRCRLCGQKHNTKLHGDQKHNELANRLQLPTTRQTATIEALNQLNTTTSNLLTATIKSRLTNYQRTLTFCVIPRIAESLPDTQIDRTAIRIPKNLRLADPEFHRPKKIDMLIGTGTALSCLSIGQINLSTQNNVDLILQKTQFGWVIGGDLLSVSQSSRKTFTHNIQFDLQKFWEIEEGTIEQCRSIEDQACEDHFAATVTRDESGRYIVALPFNEKRNQLGESRTRALNQFLALERKLNRNPELKEQYTKVINEYRTLGHMEQVTTIQMPGFYLPHHAVFKPSSTTTKIRVVFDGSAKTDTNISLNDTLRIGPILQDDLFSLLLRFRMHTYVLTGDIEKMYRQFQVRPEDRIFQRILWRDPNEEIKTYELTTVTFGLASAPYLAIRCLQQLATDEERDFPEAAARIKRDFYVDDLLTGADTIQEARLLRRQIITLMKRGGLNIRQWASNEPRLLSGLSEESIHPKILGDVSAMKTLGISWDARQDVIRYSVQQAMTTQVTKRNMLSTIAKIYDPLGLLGPITITAKIMMQQLWALKITWDESVPASIHTEWTNFANDLHLLNNSEFNRLVRIKGARQTEIHGFCDASEKAYGACLYIRTIDQNGNIRTHLLCAKSRVAPLSQVTIARLELCGAALLATLSQTVQRALTHDIDKTVFWTDSTVVLSWLRKQPSTLKTFVANRVAQIQRKTEIQSWRYVRSKDNPADLISRGITVAEFNDSHLWRHGPEWLIQERAKWPSARFTMCKELPETRTITCLVTSIIQTDEILLRYSSINKLRRVVAYCLRFRPSHRTIGPLSIEEIRNANGRIIKLLQSITFKRDIHELKIGALSKTSKLRPLTPFLDDQGILRVGGRLQNSTLPFEQRHPILLPRGHHVTKLIIRDSHQRNHHAGITATLYDVRLAYWPIDGKNTTRQIVRQCVKCFRVKPPTVEYIMGNLPAARVTEGRPFINSGVDYCGPFYIKERRFRNRVRIKIYVAVFICFATKAVHLEIVSDLSTEAFMAALKRFIARRGICKNLYSDNGTNFVGANHEITELQQTLSKDEKFNHFLTQKEISWHFMPALSPHFGGLWEAAVKSFKHHVKRVISEELFTYEQFNTFVIEIEAILNSRPLTPLSSDPNDLSALTPGHFLIGDSLTCVAETDFSETPSNRLSTWQHIQKVKQDFWTRWHKEYIHQLNLRHTWTKGSHDIQIGTVVLLKDDNLPPLCWHLGRVLHIHPGTDGVTRAVTVRTINGTYKRNVKRLAPLPITNSASPIGAATST